MDRGSLFSLHYQYCFTCTTSSMKLSNSLGLLNDFLVAVRIAFVPTVRAILRKPSLLLHPILLSREFMSHVWVLFGEGVDTNTAQIKSSLLTPNCFGVVLDVGAGNFSSFRQYSAPPSPCSFFRRTRP